MSHVVRFWGVFLVLLLAYAVTASAQPANLDGAGVAFSAVSSGVHALPVSAFTHNNRALLWLDGDNDRDDSSHDWNHDQNDKDHEWNHDGDHQWDHHRRNDGDNDGDDNGGDTDHGKNHHAPAPTPEPSTILSFGAALLIGGGVLYSRRLRRNK